MNVNPFSRFILWFRELPWHVRVAIVGGASIAIMLAVLPRSLFNSFTCEVQSPSGGYGSSNGYFIDNQVIVVGSRQDVEKVIETSSGAPTSTTLTPPSVTVTTLPTVFTTATPSTLTVVGTPSPTGTPAAPLTATATRQSGKVVLNLIEDCDLNYLDSRKALNSSATMEPRDLVMRLYEIPDIDEPAENVVADNNQRIIDVITNINSIASEKNAAISVDPNYITRLADSTSDLCGAGPGDGGGSGGKPFGGPGASNVTPYDHLQMENNFKVQWALVGNNGINWPASPGFTGRGVRVAVFDTSPYRISFPFVKRIGEAFPSPLWFPNWDAGGTTVASNHGLFVASLIHQMAPKSHIQLIRVLYEDGCGDLWTLNKGLEAYKSRMSALTGNLNKTVINMSLGIRVPDEDSDPLLASLREELETLDTLIDDAYKMGAIIIASAGNDSTKVMDLNGIITEERVKTQLPASHPDVLGVAATRPDGEPSCYTNIGDIAAPGGDGGQEPPTPGPTSTPGPTPTPDPNTTIDLCAARTFTWDKAPNPCLDMPNCEYGLIGLVETRYGPRYMLWSGTSFAAPLVSGMAALGYEQMSKARVLCLIQNGQPSGGTDPVLGTGLINLDNLIITPATPNCP